MEYIEQLDGHRLERVRLIKENYVGDTRRVEIDISDMELVLNNGFPKDVCTTRFILGEKEFIELLARYYDNKAKLDRIEQKESE